MKKTILLSILMAGVSFAGFEKWTNKDGKTAELDLVKVTEAGGEKSGEFKMRNGKTVTLKLSDLAEADKKRMEDWKPAGAAAAAGKPSTFDEIIDGNLVKYEGKGLKKFEPEAKPKKYYVFYYTASWCGPCHKFTPSLVEFYNKNKNDNFEVVVISWDQEESAMEGYAKEAKMPWPLLKLSKAAGFQKKFNHGVTGIPSVIVCDLEGKNLGNYRDLAALEKLVK